MDKTTELLPEQKARLKIDKQLLEAGWEVVSREEYTGESPQAVREALMDSCKKESDYLLFVDGKAIAVVEAKAEDNSLGDVVAEQAENYSKTPESWYGVFFEEQIPLVYLANGNKIFFKNMLVSDSDYEPIEKMHTPKKMMTIIKKEKESKFGMLPRLDGIGLRDCQYTAETEFERSLKAGKKKALCVLATGSGKTYLACLASYRMLNYTQTKRVLFLVDRNNLAKQTENEFNTFNRTENDMTMSSLYSISRLKKNEDVKSKVVISTIQKLFAVLTGKTLTEEDDDDKEENYDNQKDDEVIELGDNLKLEKNHFDLIIVDECHRSIYGKWKKVLDYFSEAVVLGLTATPTEEAYAYFDKNTVEKYTYEQSVIDGVNVPYRVFRIDTKKSQGGVLTPDKELVEIVKRTGETKTIKINRYVPYDKRSLDKTIIDRNQIYQVIYEYMDSIYFDLYTTRKEDWYSIPKTLIFAKSDKHADEIVDAVKEVFKDKFPEGHVPEGFVQKITYSAGDSTTLIRDFRNEKNFRIAVTVTLVATGTDVRPLEVVMFMADVQSDVLYAQMKGRGCRTISDDKLREVTPNADTKECFYVVDAIGVTEHEKIIPHVMPGRGSQLSLKDLLEHLSHGDYSDENLQLLSHYCSTITNRFENNALFGHHLDEFINDFGYSPKYISEKINQAFEEKMLPEFVSASSSNDERKKLAYELITNAKAKDKLLQLKKGYQVYAPQESDSLIYKGFSKETARTFIENFEKCLIDHKDSIEALSIIYNSKDEVITHSMLIELRDMLLNENRQYNPYTIWKNYRILDNEGKVKELDLKQNVYALTNLIQIARFAYKKNDKLFSLIGLDASRFHLYEGKKGGDEHKLTEEQKEIMKKIAKYIVEEGGISAQDLYNADTDLWKQGVKAFTLPVFIEEMQFLSKFLIRTA